MQLQRISVKFFTRGGAQADLPAVVPVFHDWIKNATVPGLLIDVHDYKHVPGGPGILLVGHEGDYALDIAEGAHGVSFTHKRKRETEGDVAANLSAALNNAITAAQELEKATPLTFDPSRVRVSVSDRRQAANSDATDDALRPILSTVAAELFGDGAVVSRVEGDERTPYVLEFSSEGVTDFASLASNLAARASA
ncbi:MAG: hypothetical protein ACYTGQ_16760 [Planctomycetota bacterium]|jgi:hypothetical protein